jgi:hypothetical protein
MKQWVANGRFEGTLPFNTTNDEVNQWLKKAGKDGDTVQIVFKTHLLKTDNIETLFQMHEEQFSCRTPIPRNGNNSRGGLAQVGRSRSSVAKPVSPSSSAQKAEKLSKQCILTRENDSIFSPSELRDIFKFDDDYNVSWLSVPHCVCALLSLICLNCYQDPILFHLLLVACCVDCLLNV